MGGWREEEGMFRGGGHAGFNLLAFLVLRWEGTMVGSGILQMILECDVEGCITEF